MEKRAQENLGIRKSSCKDSKGVFEKGDGLFGLKWRGVGGQVRERREGIETAEERKIAHSPQKVM